jgi:hypothetical protein
MQLLQSHAFIGDANPPRLFGAGSLDEDGDIWLTERPTATDYSAGLKSYRARPLSTRVTSAFAELGRIRKELQARLDNLPECLAGGSIESDVEDAIDALDQLHQPRLPGCACWLPIFLRPAKRRGSRAGRLASAIDLLVSCDEQVRYLAASGRWRSYLPPTATASEAQSIPAQLDEFADSLVDALWHSDDVILPRLC